MIELFENETSGAEFSTCGNYRYCLWRIWDTEKPLVMIIGLNPSTASETKNDATITKVIKVAKHNGFGGVYMMNLMAVVSKYPEILKSHSNPVGDNDGWLEKIAPKCSKIVFAWGGSKHIGNRGDKVINAFPHAFCFKQNKNGSPKHPLYCKDTTKFVTFII